MAIEPMTISSYDSDADSGYKEDGISTCSLTSSIFAYEEENNRSYHALNAGKYVLPNDEAEQNRMNIHYHAIKLAFNNLHFFSPIENPSAVLDVGTGTGVWALEVADDFPGSYVLGIDLSPIQPRYVPPNLEFQVCDLEDNWDMVNRFELVHTRYMNGLSVRNWPAFYKQAFKSLKPGGWIENQEIDQTFLSDDSTIPVDSTVQKWQQLFNDAVSSVGMSARCHPHILAQQMTQAGFINVQIREFKLPIGTWPKDRRLREAGAFTLVGLAEGLSGLSLRVFTRILGWSVEETEVFLISVRNELKQKRVHSYMPLYVVYGQKPYNAG